VCRVLPPTTQERLGRQLTASRKRLTQLRTRAISRVQHILMRHNLQQECRTNGIQTIKTKKWLSELELDSMDRLEMNQLLAQWAMHDTQLDGVNVRIEERQNEDEVASIVASIPGMGAYSSLAVASAGERLLARLSPKHRTLLCPDVTCSGGPHLRRLRTVSEYVPLLQRSDGPVVAVPDPARSPPSICPDRVGRSIRKWVRCWDGLRTCGSLGELSEPTTPHFFLNFDQRHRDFV
jgi:hypothetical protein